MAQQIPSQQTERHPRRSMEEKGVVCVERSSYSGTQNLHLGESPESTLGHYFLVCEMRELRVIHIKRLAHDLTESGRDGTLIGTRILPKPLCLSLAYHVHSKTYLNQPHPQGQQILWNEPPCLEILSAEGSESERGSPSLVCGHSAMLLCSSHGPAPSASREHELTLPGVTWPKVSVECQRFPAPC